MTKKIATLLKSLEKTADEYWNITPEVGQFINLIIKDGKSRRVLEIGTSNGYSGIWIAEALSCMAGADTASATMEPAANSTTGATTNHLTSPRLYTIESNEARFNLAKENFKKCGLDKYITQILGHAPEALDQILDCASGKRSQISAHVPGNSPQTFSSFDLAFFDATKSEHPIYFKAVAPYIKKGGLIITDNIISHREDLLPYIKSIKSSKNWRSFEFRLGNGLLISEKN